MKAGKRVLTAAAGGIGIGLVGVYALDEAPGCVPTEAGAPGSAGAAAREDTRARAYDQAGIRNPNHQAILQTAGITPTEAGLYREAGRSNVAEMVALNNAGVRGETTKLYVDAGVHNVASMVSLHERGVTPGLARLYKGYFGDSITPQQMVALHQAGITPAMAVEYGAAGVSINVMPPLRQAGVTPILAHRYHARGADCLAEQLSMHEVSKSSFIE